MANESNTVWISEYVANVILDGDKTNASPELCTQQCQLVQCKTRYEIHWSTGGKTSVSQKKEPEQYKRAHGTFNVQANNNQFVSGDLSL